jgi:hypothetical protein
MSGHGMVRPIMDNFRIPAIVHRLIRLSLLLIQVVAPHYLARRAIRRAKKGGLS